jgi:hypothetical protein
MNGHARARCRRGLLAALSIGAAATLFAGCTQGGGIWGRRTTTTQWSQPTTTMGGGHEHGHSPERLNHPPTEAQKQWSRDLVAHTKWAGQKFPNKAAAIRAGYNDIGDTVHFTHPQYRVDGREFDPNRIESLVFEAGIGTSGRLLAAMYNMERSTTPENVYDWAGNWIIWHNHDNLCWQAPEDQPGWTNLAGVVVNGRCTGGVKHTPVLMVHVWVADSSYENRCGAFASIDGIGEGSCVPEFQQNGIAAKAPPANWPWKP